MQIRNQKTKEIKEVSPEDWEAIQKNPLIKGWHVVEKVKTPPEVSEIEARKESLKLDSDKKSSK